MRQWAEQRRQRAREREARAKPLAEYWPFIDIPLDDSHRLMVAIGEVIPRTLSEEVRREVGQDMAAALFAGEIHETSLEAAYPAFLKGVYARLPSRWATISLDAPRGRGERPLIDRIADLREQWCDSGTALHFRASDGSEVFTERPDPDSDFEFLDREEEPEREARPRRYFYPKAPPPRGHSRGGARALGNARQRIAAVRHHREPEEARAAASRGRVWVCP